MIKQAESGGTIMLKKKMRIQAIAQDMVQNPTYTIRNLADKYHVSEMTVRRDIRYIEENGFPEQSVPLPGQYAAAPVSPPQNCSVETPVKSGYEFSAANALNSDSKRRIGAYAATLLKPNDVIILDTGTTINCMMQALPEDIPLTVICYNFNVMQVLYNRQNIQIILAGGYFHRSSLSFESTENTELLKRLRASKIFISTSGVEKMGLTCSNQYEVTTKSTALHSSRTKILLADSSKFGVVRSSLFAPLEEMDMIISDTGLSSDWRQYLEEKNIPLELV